MEPEDIGVGARVFDVALQGKTVLNELDVALDAGGSRKAMVKEFATTVRDRILRLELSQKGKLPAILSGVEWHRLP
jgi:hypothetical protein